MPETEFNSFVSGNNETIPVELDARRTKSRICQ